MPDRSTHDALIVSKHEGGTQHIRQCRKLLVTEHVRTCSSRVRTHAHMQQNLVIRRRRREHYFPARHFLRRHIPADFRGQAFHHSHLTVILQVGEEGEEDGNASNSSSDNTIDGILREMAEHDAPAVPSSASTSAPALVSGGVRGPEYLWPMQCPCLFCHPYQENPSNPEVDGPAVLTLGSGTSNQDGRNVRPRLGGPKPPSPARLFK